MREMFPSIVTEPTTRTMLLLNKDQIADSVTILDVLQAVEEAFLLQESGNYLMPDRMHIEHDGNVLLLMPAFSAGHFSTKLAAVFPDNTALGLPVIHATVILNDATTGKPLALLEGATVTGLRTGAIGGLGIAYTTPRDISTVGLIGAGFQGYHQLLFAAAVRNIKEVRIFDPFVADPGRFVEKLRALLPHVQLMRSSSAKELVENSEVIITATTAQSPVIPAEKMLLENKHFIGIGSYTPAMREYPDTLYELVDRVFIDTDLAAKESGDLSAPLESGILKKKDLVRLGQLINGKIGLDSSKTTFFKSVGMALFDLLTAKLIVEKAQARGIGTKIDF